MIWIQANTLGLILRVTRIILDKGILPTTHPDYPLEVCITRNQLVNLEDSIVPKLASDIILGNLCFWDSAEREYLDVSYDAPKRTLTINDRQYFISDLDSPRPLIMINI